MPAAGVLTDKIGARPVVITGIGLALAGTAAYTQITAVTPYAYLAIALLAIGAGLGATITPSMAAAFQAIGRAAIPSATIAISTIQRVAGSLGTALLAVTLQRAMTTGLPGFHGGIAQAGALAFTEAVTLVADTHVPDGAYRDVAAEFSADEIGALVSLIVTINAWNAIGVLTRSWEPGSYQP